MKQVAPAAARNRAPIAEVLAEELPPSGLVLEVASGTGEHAVHFARAFPALEWQPSDPDQQACASIAAWRAEAGLPNLRAPLALDAAAPDWPLDAADALVCINMIHISPWKAAQGLFAGARRSASIGRRLGALRALSGGWGGDRSVQSRLRCQPEAAEPGMGHPPDRGCRCPGRKLRPLTHAAGGDAGEQSQLDLPQDLIFRPCQKDRGVSSGNTPPFVMPAKAGISGCCQPPFVIARRRSRRSNPGPVCGGLWIAAGPSVPRNDEGAGCARQPETPASAGVTIRYPAWRRCAGAVEAAR